MFFCIYSFFLQKYYDFLNPKNGSYEILTSHSFLFFDIFLINTKYHPFTLPVVSPATKNFWQKINTSSMGSKLNTDRANT